MRGYFRPEHGPHCHRIGCPGCYDEWQEAEEKTSQAKKARKAYTFHCEFGRNVTKYFATDAEAINHRMFDCLDISYFPEGCNDRQIIWQRKDNQVETKESQLTLKQMVEAARRIILDRHRQLVPGPGIDLEADSRYNDELIDIASSLTESEIIRYNKILT